MPDVNAALEHCKWLIEHGRGQEPAKLVLPRIERQRRIANKEKRTRVQFDCDEQLYSDWHKELKRYVEAAGNHPLIAYAIMVRLLAQLSSESISKLAEDEQPMRTGSETLKESLGDA